MSVAAAVRGHNPQGLDRLLIKPASGVPGRRRHHGRQLVTKATRMDAGTVVSHTEMPDVEA